MCTCMYTFRTAFGRGTFTPPRFLDSKLKFYIIITMLNYNSIR